MARVRLYRSASIRIKACIIDHGVFDFVCH